MEMDVDGGCVWLLRSCVMYTHLFGGSNRGGGDEREKN